MSEHRKLSSGVFRKRQIKPAKLSLFLVKSFWLERVATLCSSLTMAQESKFPFFREMVRIALLEESQKISGWPEKYGVMEKLRTNSLTTQYCLFTSVFSISW